MSRIIYGGTFDPLHLAHLRLAWEALEQLRAEVLCFLPSAAPPHRPCPGASAQQRAQWIAVAIDGISGFALDDRELRRQGPSYSFDTLNEIRAEIGPLAPLIWLIGEDALAGLPGWFRSAELFGLAHFAVLRRPGTHDRASLEARFADRRQSPQTLLQSPAGGLCWLDNTLIEYSASAVRARLAHGLSLRYLVDERIRESVETCPAYRVQSPS